MLALGSKAFRCRRDSCDADASLYIEGHPNGKRHKGACGLEQICSYLLVTFRLGAGQGSSTSAASAKAEVMRSAELKVVYRRQTGQKSRVYRLSLYLYYPRELEAMQTNFFSHMFQTTRLHTPEVLHLCLLI